MDNFKFAGCGLIHIVVPDFQNMRESPVNPLPADIFYKKIPARRGLVNSDVFFVFKFKNLFGKIPRLERIFQMPFQVKLGWKALLFGDLQCVVCFDK